MAAGSRMISGASIWLEARTLVGAATGINASRNVATICLIFVVDIFGLLLIPSCIGRNCRGGPLRPPVRKSAYICVLTGGHGGPPLQLMQVACARLAIAFVGS